MICFQQQNKNPDAYSFHRGKVLQRVGGGRETGKTPRIL
jgi:hypothetical protein